jgi:hypothetical protein
MHLVRSWYLYTISQSRLSFLPSALLSCEYAGRLQPIWWKSTRHTVLLRSALGCSHRPLFRVCSQSQSGFEAAWAELSFSRSAMYEAESHRFSRGVHQTVHYCLFTIATYSVIPIFHQPTTKTWLRQLRRHNIEQEVWSTADFNTTTD